MSTDRAVRRFASGVLLMAIGLCGTWAAQPVRADANASADSNNWCFSKWWDVSTTSTTYWNPDNALAGTYTCSTQAWNEGGTTGPKSTGSQPKFMNVGGTPTGYVYGGSSARVPSPGTTYASGYSLGSSKVTPGTLWGTNYTSTGVAGGVVKEATVPAGGYGKFTSSFVDPSEIDLPNPSAPGDTFDLHVFLDLGGSSESADPVANGSSHAEIDFHLDLQGAGSDYASDIFDYDASSSGGSSTSTMLSASGVQFYLNDDSGDLEFNPSTAVTADQLKTYLDDFQTSNGWNPGSTDILVGIDVPIDNSAVGVGNDPSIRQFLMDDDVTAEGDVELAPEPGMVAAIALSAVAGAIRRRRKRD